MDLVVVSNRVARAKANEPMTGGLAAALLPVVEQSGAIWVGSSGRVRNNLTKDSFAEIESLGAGALALLDLPAAHYGGYYEGFANSALWPALHSRTDLINVSQDNYQCYREVNAFMARALMRFNKPTAAFWVQDYHFLTLGAEMRELGVRNPLGFFLHTPWPARRVIAGVPHHRELVEAMLAYDLIGFQTEDDCENFTTYLRAEIGLDVDDSIVTSRFGTSRLAVFPIGIDVDGFAAQAQRAASHPDVSRLRKSLHGERLAIGVDRVDYSKGLVNRISAFDRLFEIQPSLKRSVSLLQIATPSRGGIEAYQQLAGRVVEAGDGRQRPPRRGGLDADPLSQQGFQPDRAGRFLSRRAGRCGDAAARRYESRRQGICRGPESDRPRRSRAVEICGAANELDTALLVNPAGY